VSVYGTVDQRLKLRGFSWKLGVRNFAPLRALVITPQLRPSDLPKGHAYTLEPGRPTPGLHNLLRPPIASSIGIGILTDFPSATHFCLTLGADSPCADERCAGNLGLSASRLFTCFIATHVSIRTSDGSSTGSPTPSQPYGTLSYRFRSQRSGNRDQTTSSGCCAAPNSILAIDSYSSRQRRQVASSVVSQI